MSFKFPPSWKSWYSHQFSVFRVRFFLSEPFLHQTHLFLWHKGSRIKDRKRLGDDDWHFFSCKSYCSGIVGVFSALSFSFLFRDSWSHRVDESVMLNLSWTRNHSTPFSQSVLSNTFTNLPKPFQSLVFVLNSFHLPALMVSVELQFTPHCNKQQ